MNLKKIPVPARILIGVGLVMTTTSTLIAHYIALPDFFRGMMIGVGAGFEITGAVIIRRTQKSGMCS